MTTPAQLTKKFWAKVNRINFNPTYGYKDIRTGTAPNRENIANGVKDI